MGSGRSSFGVLIVAVFAFGWLASASAAPIGKAESVVPATTYVRGSAAHGLAINDALEQEDVIRTSSNGSTRVRFLDDTMLTIGPDAEIRLDKGVFDGSQARTLSVEVIFGAMRFVSGVSSRNSYEIRTPIAAIGVRGTVVDIEQIDTRTIVNFVDGSGPICIIATGACRTIGAGEAALAIGPNGFSPATAAEARRLFLRLDGAHLALARQAGRDPSAPSGAAASAVAPASSNSNNGQGNSNNTGSSNTATGGNLPYVPPPPYNQIVLATNPITPVSETLTYIADPASRPYGSANPGFTGTVSGNHADTATGTAIFTSPATAATIVGSYPIDGSGLSGNFIFEQADSNATALAITPRPITVTADAKSKTYGDANPPLTFTTSSLGAGIAISGALATTATAASIVGDYAITQGTITDANNSNYNISYTPATLMVIPATLTYKAEAASRPAGTPNPTFNGTVTGLKNNDVFSGANGVTTGVLTFTTTANIDSLPGPYAITGGGLTVISPNYDLTIQQDPGNISALTITPATSPFSFTEFRVTGRGDLDIPVQVGNQNQIGNRGGFLYVPASSLTFDPSTNEPRSVTVSGTPNIADDPNRVVLTRSATGGAQSHTIIGTAVLPGQGTSPVPAYFLTSWSAGTIDYSAPGIPLSGITSPLGPNQAFQIIGWGYTGDLFLNPVSFGGNVLFNFEPGNATPAVWSDGHSAPGTFTNGQVAVAIGTTSLRYGMTGTVNMPTIGTFTMSTPGGISNPSQSNAVGLLTGQIGRIQASPNFGTISPTPNVTYVASGSANACPDGCFANIEFNTIAPGKIGVVYAFGDGQNFDNGNDINNVEVTGIATFAQAST